jgi:hypothetical protein
MKPFDRGEQFQRASLADVAAWQSRRPAPPPPWLAPLVSIAALAAIGVLVMAAWHVWGWVR